MLALTLAVMLSAPAGDPAVARFGKPLKGLKATPVAAVLASAKDGDTVRLEGKVKVKAPAAADVAHLKSEGAGASAASRVSVEAYGVELR